MLADGKIDSLDTHLEQFKLNDQNRQIDLANLLKEYGQLLDEYKDLKKAYEEKGKIAITKPAATSITAVTARPQNRYVLVLVDGNNYIFNHELIREKEEGGMRAARMLNEAVENYLQQSTFTRGARVHVKIYADLTNLSKQLAKSKVIGLEKRSLSPFSAAFTRAISTFDFIDALDEEGTRFKIREQFKIASEDTACCHILYAACHDPASLSQLVPFSGERNKITLVQGAGWNPGFHQFDLNVTQFKTVFRWSELPVAAPASKSAAAAAPKQNAIAAVQRSILIPGLPTPRKESWRRDGSFSVSDSAFGDLSPTETNGSDEQDGVGREEQSAYPQTAKGGPSKPQKDSQLCRYFQKGFCRFGNKCNFQHVPKGLDGVNDHSSISSLLPAAPIPGFIPLNKSHQRIDTYLAFPSPVAWKIYNARFAKAKPCNTFHLQQECSAGNCTFDHSDIEPEAKQVLDY
ncbi:uncharacterized protein ALTATR162_LOCUS643 [Alternaria atra]|uniref:C3H1-type domain-containing protein n=1 Tax=Alternaria atra TaxID=119953 RepID=A0A8J2MWA1_9PLEO|nr:uncharacterized protein ALTATR162_LOCUS643 [Alternaria atra]CAG5140133.1 unnamed protein product [Alternaria atra]